MADEAVVLDPVEFCPERVEVSLEELGLSVRVEGVDWGEAAITAQMVREAQGETSSDGHRPAVPMSIPIRVHEESAVSLAEAAHKLQSVVGRWQDEGGWARRDFADLGNFAGSLGYRIIRHTAQLSGLQGWLFAHRRDAPDVVLTVMRQPVGYATVEAESPVVESEGGARELILELAEVLGTAPGLIRIRITNEGEEDLRGLIFAGESRDHPQDETADTTAALVYEAEDLTPMGGATVGEGQVVHTGLGAGWLLVLDSEIDGVGHMTHKGVRRLWVRASKGGAEELQLRLRWRALGSLQWSENRLVTMPSVGSQAVLLDLGECRPQLAALGDERWEWQLMARAPGGAGELYIDKFRICPTEHYALVRAPDVVTAADALSTKSPSIVEDKSGAGTISWTGASNAKASDDVWATAKLKAGQQTHYLLARNLGFALPEAAAVRGFVTQFELDRSSFEPFVFTQEVRLFKGGTVVGDNKATVISMWPTTDAVFIYGDAGDLWGEVWTPEDINGANFGVGIRAICSGGEGEGEARVDRCSLGVYYSPEPADENRVCFAGRSIEFRSDGIFRQHPTDDVWGELIPQGFLPVASPSGLEGRKSRFIVIPTQGDLGELSDSGSNPLSAQAMVRGAYHFARESA